MSDDKGTPAAAGSAQRPKHRHLADSVSDYIVDHAKEDDVLRRLRMETLTLGRISVMQVGTFTGYSALCVARALPDHGKLVTLDVSEEWTAVAKRYWEEAGVAHKIDLRLAPAVESLDRMIADGLRGHFDIAFVDADKANYPEYYERALALIHVGGLLVVDNTLWSGKVASAEHNDDDTTAIRSLNAKMKEDGRVEYALLALNDGVTLVRKLHD